MIQNTGFRRIILYYSSKQGQFSQCRALAMIAEPIEKSTILSRSLAVEHDRLPNRDTTPDDPSVNARSWIDETGFVAQLL